MISCTNEGKPLALSWGRALWLDSGVRRTPIYRGLVLGFPTILPKIITVRVGPLSGKDLRLRQLRPLLALHKCSKLQYNANAIWDGLALGNMMRNSKCNAMKRAIYAMMRAFLNQGEAFSNDITIDSKGWVAGESSCDESELELIVSCKVDVDGMVNCEEDGKDNEVKSSEVITNNFRLKENRNDDMKEDVSKNGAESVVMDVGEFLNGEDENLVCKSNVGSLVVGHESNIFEVDEESGTLSVYDSSVHDFSKRVLTCDDMFYKKWNLKDLSEVIDTTKDSKALLELSKEVDQDNHGLEGNFMGDSGLGNDVDSFVLLGRTTLVENTKTSVINVQENNAYNILKNQEDKEDNEEIRGLVTLVNGVADSSKNYHSNYVVRGVNKVVINFSKREVNCNFNKVVKNRKVCDGEQDGSKEDDEFVLCDLMLGKNRRHLWGSNYIDGPRDLCEHVTMNLSTMDLRTRLLELELIIPNTYCSVDCIQKGVHLLGKYHEDGNKSCDVATLRRLDGKSLFGHSRVLEYGVSFGYIKFDMLKWPTRKKIVVDGSSKIRRGNELKTKFAREGIKYEVGDWVYLKLQPYMQISVRQSHQHMFSAKVCGAFQVMVKVGKVAYRLKSLEIAKILSVFYVYKLRKWKMEVTEMGIFTTCDEAGMIVVEPQTVLNRIMQMKYNRAVVHVLIQWANGSVADATWEADLHEILLMLRDDFRYRLLCGCKYESMEALLANCPGINEDDH
ncbi:retrotransposable element Tf2 [Tanacetum coccineum]